MKDKDTRSTHPAGTHTISDDLKSFDAKIPFWKGIPFGLQHVMAMFVANLTPLILIAGVAKMDTSHKEWLIQGGLLVAGLGTIPAFPPVAHRQPPAYGHRYFLYVLCSSRGDSR